MPKRSVMKGLSHYRRSLTGEVCLRCQMTSRIQNPPRSRPFATSTSNRYEPRPYAEPTLREPRWAITPPQYKAPLRSSPPVFDNEFPVNEDPHLLNEIYDELIGQGGNQLLKEETKWLAVTHKSFDHGKRGYNERLALLGMKGRASRGHEARD